MNAMSNWLSSMGFNSMICLIKVEKRINMSDKKINKEEVYDNASYLPKDYKEKLESYFKSGDDDIVFKLQNFTKYVPRQSLTRFLTRYEIFKKILKVQGSIVEVGVLGGGSLMSWAQLSAIYEHLNHQRKVFGFDVFGSAANLSESDMTGSALEQYKEGSMRLDSYDDILKSIEVFDSNRFLASVEKVFLIKGFAEKTIPKFLNEYPETIVSLLYLDVNLYEPTKAALEKFYPRMPKGSVIVFDELNDRGLPGETLALLDTIGVNNLAIKRFTHDTKISYVVL